MLKKDPKTDHVSDTELKKQDWSAIEDGGGQIAPMETARTCAVLATLKTALTSHQMDNDW